MGICSSTKKNNPILIVKISEKNQESERGLAERLKEILREKNVFFEANPIEIDNNLLYMKIDFYTNKNSKLNLCNGKEPVEFNDLNKFANEIAKKIRNNE